jgi:hypothetical protein
MALTPQEAEDRYAEKIYLISKEFEESIDKILVDRYEVLRRDDEISLDAGEFWKFENRVTYDNIKQVAEVIKDKYREWHVEYEEKKCIFKFKHKNENQSLINLVHNVEERFSNLDIREVDRIKERTIGTERGNLSNNKYGMDDDIPF